MIKPTEVKAKAKRLEEQNYKFRTFLKNHADDDELDSRFLELHKELFTDYDCCKCNNCCKAYRIDLDDDEITAISSFLGQSEDSFVSEYLVRVKDEYGIEAHSYSIKGKPCVFLNKDGRCRVQDCKPAVCKGFPYTNQPDRLSSVYSVIEHAEVCLVVFEILERLKRTYEFRKKP
jgi:Fe-S-cluster containining protein